MDDKGKKDIRTDKRAVTLEHQSGRGKVYRNSGDFTRGSQLFTHHLRMWWAGVKLPLILWVAVTVFLVCLLGSLNFKPHEVQLVGMKVLAELWAVVELDPAKAVNLTLPDGSITRGQMAWVPYHPAVEEAWNRAVGIALGGSLAAIFFCVPLSIWFVDYSNRKGRDILKEKHERGSILVDQSELAYAIKQDNIIRRANEAEAKGLKREQILALDAMSVRERTRRGFHAPYVLAGIQYPWRSEQQHTMLLGTTGTGKTTELKKLVLQARARGHRCVIFDLTGSFVESFYNPETDHIMNPRDERCRAWSIFNDADDYVDLMNAALALIPDPHGRGGDDFWQKAARILFVEMCVKLREEGHCSNGALAHHLMEIELGEINKKLSDTIAAPLVSERAAKMAESVRATFNAHANAIRFLPDATKARPPFSMREWMTRENDEGSILFLTSSYSDMVLNKPLLTMWLNIAMQSMFAMGRTRDLRTWFLIDEVHALHRVPAIEQGLQTARQVGGAIVLGMHSFEKLKETYGDEGGRFIDGLCGTKLLLRSADAASARHASETIGEREIRQMDEAYSYGANTIRDGTTITPTKKVEPLVLATDMRDLPDLHGFVRFGQGFPAARVQIKWRDYPKQAEGSMMVKELRAAAWPPLDEGSGEAGGAGAEGDVFNPETGGVWSAVSAAPKPTGAAGSGGGGDGGMSEGELPLEQKDAASKVGLTAAQVLAQVRARGALSDKDMAGLDRGLRHDIEAALREMGIQVSVADTVADVANGVANSSLSQSADGLNAATSSQRISTPTTTEKSAEPSFLQRQGEELQQIRFHLSKPARETESAEHAVSAETLTEREERMGSVLAPEAQRAGEQQEMELE